MDMVDFSSNDYLALSQHPKVLAGAGKYLEKYGASAGGARLMSGDSALFRRLEERIADFKQKPAALLFGSGYLANIGIIPACIGRGGIIFSDRLNHASIYDGCRLSGAELARFQHNDLDHLESLLRQKPGNRQGLIVVESIYSMDGDRCPLPELVGLKEKYGCLLMVDEAHATGIYGISGSGLIEAAGVSDGVDLSMGTFGKALGSYGAYVAASRQIIHYLINRARSFIFSTALPPAVLGASLAAVEIVRAEPQLRRELLANTAFFKKELAAAGIGTDPEGSQIVPLILGDSAVTLQAAEELRERGIYATAVRPPTVPAGSSRLRFSITRHHSREILATAAAVIAAVVTDIRGPVYRNGLDYG